jgi:hypothetical protein
LQDEIIKTIREIREKSGWMLVLKVEGRLNGNLYELNQKLIKELAEEMGFLHCKLDISQLKAKDYYFKQDTKNKSVKEIEMEFFRERLGLKEKEVVEIMEVVNLLGRKFSSEVEKRLAIKKAKEIISRLVEG